MGLVFEAEEARAQEGQRSVQASASGAHEEPMPRDVPEQPTLSPTPGRLLQHLDSERATTPPTATPAGLPLRCPQAGGVSATLRVGTRNRSWGGHRKALTVGPGVSSVLRGSLLRRETAQ